MASPKELYRHACENIFILPNSGLLRELPETDSSLSDMSQMSLARNFLGDRGVLPLLSVIKHATSLHTLDLSENGIGNNGVKAICHALRHHQSLKSLELSGNPFTYLAARRLVVLCGSCPSLTFIGVEKTLMTEPLKEGIIRRLNKVIEMRNKEKIAPAMNKKENNCSLFLSEENIVDVQVPSLPTLINVPTFEVVKDGCNVDGEEPQNLPCHVDQDKSNEEDTSLAAKKEEDFFQSTSPILLSAEPLHKKCAIWLDDEIEEEEKKGEEEGGKNEQQMEEINNVAVDGSAGKRNSSKISSIIFAEPATFQESRGVNNSTSPSPSKFRSGVNEEIGVFVKEEEILVSDNTNVDGADGVLPLCSYTRFSSQPLSDERIEIAADASGVSSLTLEVRAAMAKGKLEELESMAKEDEFLDLFAFSEAE